MTVPLTGFVPSSRGLAPVLWVLCFSCVNPDATRVLGERPLGEVAEWRFTAVDDTDSRVVALWPTSAGAPARLKRHLATAERDGSLIAVVEGRDPLFLWRFEQPVVAALLRAEVSASAAGRLQLFWNTAECPTFRESCSAIFMLDPGEQAVDFPLPFRDPIRELRLDLPEENGARLVFDHVALYSHPWMRSAWHSPHAELELTTDGLEVRAEEDPWLSVELAGLPAAIVDTIEVTLSGPARERPQLFWHGSTCSYFQERCSLMLVAGDGGATSLAADLGSHDGWTGEIRGLRLDPGQGGGRYILRDLSLRRGVSALE